MHQKNPFENKKVKSYRQFQLIDRSNFEVYKVIDLDDNNIYKAIKVFPKQFLLHNPAWIPGLRSEINTLKKFQHQNIIRFYEILETPNNFYLVMEYCKDGNLHKYLQANGGTLSESEAIDIFKQILNGYHELYTQKIMHRDIKLSNILMNDGVIKLADFGFAKEAEVSDSNVGTLNYKAPEVAKSEPYDIKADIWSLGVCLYEMLYGKVPFSNSDKIIESGLSNRELKLEFPVAAMVSEDIKELLRGMLSQSPEKRIDWVRLFNHYLFRNSLNENPFKVTDIPILSKVAAAETDEKLLNKLLEEEKTEEICKMNYESEVELMLKQEIDARVFAKELQNLNFRQKHRYFERRYLHHSNVLRNFAFVLERGLRLDPELTEAIYVYAVFSKKLLVLSKEFMTLMMSKQWVFVKEEHNEGVFNEFRNSLFHEQLTKVMSDEYLAYETFVMNGVFKQFRDIEYSQNQFFNEIKGIIGEEKPKMVQLNESMLNLLRDYFYMKVDNLEKMKEEEAKKLWTQMFYLYHCYQYMNFQESKWELSFDNGFDDGFDFLGYRDQYRTMEEFTTEADLRLLLERLLFV